MMPPQHCQITLHISYFQRCSFNLRISFTTANVCVILTSIVHQY